MDNFIHADMHPGNILVRQGKSRKRLFKSKPHVIFLDVGMTAELSGSDRVNLVEFFKAVARRDGRTAAECALSLSKQQNCPDPNAFIEVNFPLTFMSFNQVMFISSQKNYCGFVPIMALFCDCHCQIICP